jgi:hypothetical protein
MPNAFNLGSDERSMVYLASLPVTLATHVLLDWNKDITKAMVQSNALFPAYFLYASYAIPQIIAPDYENIVRVGSALSLGMYPLSLYLADSYAMAHRNNPHRVSLSSYTAFLGLSTGFWLADIQTDAVDLSSEGEKRYFATYSLLGAVGGWIGGNLYKDKEYISSGLPLHIFTHTLIGLSVAMTASLQMELDEIAQSSFMLASMDAAALISMYINYDSKLSYKKAGYGFGGTLLGMTLVAYGGSMGNYDAISPKSMATAMTIGGIAGYIMGMHLARNLPDDDGSGFYSHLKINPIPVYEQVASIDGSVSSRYRIPGISLSF